MRKPTNRQLQRWLLLGLVPPIIGLNAYVLSQFFGFFQNLLQMIAISAILAFLLDYPVKLLRRFRVNHTLAVMLVFLVTTTILVVLGITLVPILIEQITQLANRLPQWFTESQKNLQGLDEWARSRNYNLDLQGFIGRSSDKINTQLEQQAQDIAKIGVDLALGTLSGFIDSIIVFVLTFYMLLYGKHLWRGLIKYLPNDIAVPLDESLKLNFNGFFLSQLLLAALMTIALIPFFFWLKVPFALLFTLLIGVAELIPLIGATLGIGIVFLLLLFQDAGMALQVGFVCVVLQQIRDNVVAPKLMGDIAGLNPIYVFIVLLIGLQYGGVLGAFLAVPIAGTIKGTFEAILAQRQALKQAPLLESLEESRLNPPVKGLRKESPEPNPE
ncbi:AI-2E family transporter [filamentous cyanobacterium LEGE 11480]|uniref:AI-2E family transporter n=1 Tax=Romeriopsis navalis LEGE 11480 TaxID=2777977 RepID=A0A928VP46_9CYAN|nr:AI-2E family transporter [Romeriopsis navalis]MBE9029469.1 AI-2E family transporter [Romeriopsis navalis LEGE 11480]